MSYLKVLILSFCCAFALAPSAQAVMHQLALNPGFDTAPPADPNFVADQWRYTSLSTTGYAVVTRDLIDGLPAPCLRMESAATATGTNTTEKGAYQVFAVTPGTKYQVNAKWRGRLVVQPLTGGMHRASVLCYIDFSANGTTGWTSFGGTSRYLKTLDYGYQRGNFNVPYTSTLQDYAWDWEDITLSPQTGYTASDDVLAVPDGMNFMRIRFGLLTYAQPESPASWVEIDNVVLTACQGALVGDKDNDCDVDIKDIAQIANTWLDCGIAPGASVLCW